MRTYREQIYRIMASRLLSGAGGDGRVLIACKSLEGIALSKIEDTENRRFKRACRRHLQDLIKAHPYPPEDVKLRSLSVLRRIEPAPLSSYHTSPAELCSEIGE